MVYWDSSPGDAIRANCDFAQSGSRFLSPGTRIARDAGLSIWTAWRAMRRWWTMGPCYLYVKRLLGISSHYPLRSLQAEGVLYSIRPARIAESFRRPMPDAHRKVSHVTRLD